MPTITPSELIDGVVVVEPNLFGDERGYFVETYRREWFPKGREMIQGNRGNRVAGCVVGLHYHLHQADYWYVPFGKCRVVLHDLRQGSPTDGATQVIDLGARDDMAALGLCARFLVDGSGENPVYRYEIKSQAYLATTTRRAITKQPIASWIFDGQIKRSEYPIADLKSDLINASQEFYVRTIAYDPYNGQQLGEDLQREGLVAVRMAQNQANFILTQILKQRLLLTKQRKIKQNEMICISKRFFRRLINSLKIL